MSFFRRLWRAFAVACLLTSSLAVLSHAAAAEEVVNIYSYREPGLIEPMLKAFTEKTGIKTNMIFSKDGLVERMSAEGKNSPADVLLTNEFGFLVQAKDAGVTQSLKSPALEAGDARRAARSGGALVRADAPCPRRLRLEGARRPGRHHLRGACRSEVEGQDLHSLRPAHL